MMKLNRRRLLAGLGVAVALPAAYAGHHYWRYVRTSDGSPIILAILDKHLGSIEISDDSKRRFLEDFIKDIGADHRRKAAWLGLVARIYAHANPFALTGDLQKQFRRLEDRVVTKFILNSDLLEKGTRATQARYEHREWTCIGVNLRTLA